MIKTQRIIKYCAIVFAIYLTFNIIFGILYGVMSIGNIFNNDEVVTENLNNVDINISNDINYLDIDLNNVGLEIKNSKNFNVETNSNKVKITTTNNKLIINDESTWLFNDTDKKVIVYIPNDIEFDNIDIKTGAGKVNIDKIKSNKLHLDLGAGKVTINEINTKNKTEIDTGAGKFTINDGIINNLDMDMGVGKVFIKALIKGDSEIDAGVGETTLNLIGSIDDYKISIDKGIGDTKISNETIKDNNYYGNGSNIIDIDGGVGKINVDFIE